MGVVAGRCDTSSEDGGWNQDIDFPGPVISPDLPVSRNLWTGTSINLPAVYRW